MRTRALTWADGTPAGTGELTPEDDEDHRLLDRLERLRLTNVGVDGAHAGRDRSLAGQLADLLPQGLDQAGPLTPLEALALLELGPGMRLAQVGWEAKLRFAQELDRSYSAFSPTARSRSR